jgi:hypothetical protein
VDARVDTAQTRFAGGRGEAREAALAVGFRDLGRILEYVP